MSSPLLVLLACTSGELDTPSDSSHTSDTGPGDDSGLPTASASCSVAQTVRSDAGDWTAAWSYEDGQLASIDFDGRVSGHDNNVHVDRATFEFTETEETARVEYEEDGSCVSTNELSAGLVTSARVAIGETELLTHAYTYDELTGQLEQDEFRESTLRAHVDQTYTFDGETGALDGAVGTVYWYDDDDGYVVDGIVESSLDEDGHITAVSYSEEGSSSDSNWATREYQYDAQGRLTHVSVSAVGDITPFLSPPDLYQTAEIDFEYTGCEGELYPSVYFGTESAGFYGASGDPTWGCLSLR